MPTFNIYVPSYHRSNAIRTAHCFEYCTYLVRKSEETAYRNAGVKNILAVEDELICSAEKAFSYIVFNTPEDVVCICDDDIDELVYRTDELETIADPLLATREVERIAQIVYDAGIGYCASPIDIDVRYYDKPFKFSGVTGALKIYNKEKFKARNKMKLMFLADMEVELQELLLNRIILIPNYLCLKSAVDKNAGGNSDNKSLAQLEAENDILKNKWGMYYKKANGGKAGRINVKR